MKIKSLRWGYDGGGFACGPTEGNSVVEIVAMDDDGKLLFSMASSNGEGLDFKVCDVPVFDIMINLADEDVDFMAAFDKVCSHAIEEYGGLWGESVPDEILSSRYSDLIAITFASLEHYMHTSVEDEVLPEEFIKRFIDEEGEIANVPEINFGDFDEEE